MPMPMPPASSVFEPWLSFAAAYALLVALPGPNFLVVAKACVSPGRRAGLAAALGVACGASLLAVLSGWAASRLAVGPHVVLLAHAVFALLLLLLGWRTIGTSARPGAGAAVEVPRRGFFALAFATALSNPVSAAFFGSSLLAGQAGEARLSPAGAGGSVFLVAGLWFGAIGLVLSVPPLRRLQERHGRRLDLAIGLALILMGCATVLRLVPP